MWTLLPLVLLLQGVLGQTTAISVADLPQCARDCLSNSTSVVATTCASLNVACLCKTSDFVSTFYCCLSTQCKTAEQAVAITFNQQQCAAVNATAPDFVGCSPLKSTTSSSAAHSTITSMSSSSSSVPGLTVTTIITEKANFTEADRATATFDGRALFTGTCTVPLFALLAISNQHIMFPEVGCALSRQDCCPFDGSTNGFITKCPEDYFTTANSCCPSGYKIYNAGIGGLTPCYSIASTTIVPATTPALDGVVIITDRVFSRKYDLTTATTTSEGLSTGVIAAISVVAATIIAITAAVLWWVKQRRKKEIAMTEKGGATFPAEEPVLPPQQDSTSPQELASPDPASYRSSAPRFWSFGSASSPPAYETDKPIPVSRNVTPHELPGSFFINEHHPVFSASPSVTEMSTADTSPMTPVRSPALSATVSPQVTPLPDDFDARAISPEIGSPGGKPRMHRMPTDHSNVSGKN